ncbi:connectin-like [Anopheles merus]|uniref:connectin-like n=1 Tax=Anopheles merus TaxID=30066 RepID=UPI001BE42F6E|nr:connectin-like [Anopheles merus]
MSGWIGWLLIVANVASSLARLEMHCFHECYIYNFKSRGDTFAFQHIADYAHVVNMNNVRMKRVHQRILEQLPPFVDTVKIARSGKLKWISVPQSLRSLEIKFTGLRRIDIAPNSSLNTLNIIGSDLVKVPLAFKNAPMLKLLGLYSCKFNAIDLATFCDYPNLSELFLESNQIRYVVNTSKRNCSIYKALTTLTLTGNMLTTVNMELFNVFVNMVVLSLNQNRITTLSGRLVHPTMGIFSVYKNMLEHVDLCGWDVPSMKNVFLAANRLTTLPECINNWTSVSKLQLSCNQMVKFSIESVAGMNNLESIVLECNKLTEIMLNSVHFPPNLSLLRIGRNYLTSLDLSFIPVRSLQVSVEYNLISSFDASNTSPNVTRLYMVGNQIDCTWESRLEQLYGECTRNDSITLFHKQSLTMCGNGTNKIIYV